MTVRMVIAATCSGPGCEWAAAGPGSEWDQIWRAAERHLAPGHPVSVVAVPRQEGKNDG